MYSQHWNVLLVDDDSDVLSVSKLALKKLTVYGLPLALHTATSKASAIELLRTTLSRKSSASSQVALAVIDVVMESDHAGLELCAFIREEMNNQSTQIWVRTGQAGLAPERAVMDRYDINGYLSKAEATEDKLYSVVKSSVREHCLVNLSESFGEMLHELIQISDSREGMIEILRDFRASMQVDAQGRRLPGVDIKACYFIGNRAVETGGFDEREARALRERLGQGASVTIPAFGDRYSVDGRDFLIEIAPSPTMAALTYVGRVSVSPPSAWLRVIHANLRSFAGLWKKSANFSSNRL